MSETASATIDDLDELVCTLAHPVRRSVIRQVAANPAGTSLADLAALVAEAESGVAEAESGETNAGEAESGESEPGETNTAESKLEEQASLRELRIALHHVHLPKLEDAGLLTYDEERTRVETTRDEPAGSRRWQVVAAMDGVVTLVESDDGHAEPASADERIRAN